jgi:predicted phage tail protein
MTFSLWHFLIPYGAFVLLFVVFALIDVVHMVKFGTFGWVNYFALVIFLAGTAFVVWGTAQLLAPTDWTQIIGSTPAAESFFETPEL